MTGTTSNVRRVALERPETNAIAIGDHEIDLYGIPMVMGIRPSIVVTVVINTGLILAAHASIIPFLRSFRCFTRTFIKSAIDKPDSKDEKEIKDVKYPTVWNQLEAAMAFGLKRPLLIIVEKGLVQEAMLKDRYEFRTVTTSPASTPRATWPAR